MIMLKKKENKPMSPAVPWEGEWMTGSLADDIMSFIHSIRSILLLERQTAGAANYSKRNALQ